MEKNIEFKQIILATDGESNVGSNPVIIAEEGHKSGVTISTIGIVDSLNKETPMTEIQNIALAGGGIWEMSDINSLTSAMSMVTMKSVHMTIEQAVNKELKQIVGTEFKDMHPSSRKKVTDIIDKLGDEINIKCCVVIDCSGSMVNKINISKHSIINLLRVLSSRKGKTSISVIGYPGVDNRLYDILCDFTENISELEEALIKIQTGGTTPTGPALDAAIKMLNGEITGLYADEEDALLRSNIV